VTSTSAALNGTGNPNGEATTGLFRISTTNPVTCNDTFGTRVPATSGTGLGSGTTNQSYQITTMGLTPGTLYYFCAIAQSSVGTAFGSVVTFTLYYWLLQRMPVKRLALIAYIIPVEAVLLGTLIDEPFSARILAGSALVIVGVALAVRG